METIARLVAPLAGLIALVAMVRETLDHRGASGFPLVRLFAHRFPVPVPDGTPAAPAACAGAASVLLPLAVLAARGWLRVAIEAPTVRWLSLALLTVVIKAAWVFAEEIIFRGALITQVAIRTRTSTAVVVSALVFAVVHLGRAMVPNALSLVVYILDGLIFGVLAVRTGTLWAPTAWHLAKNLTIWILGWSDSLQFAQGPLDVRVAGPAVWTGTAHQAGRLDVLVTAVLLVGLLTVVRPRRPLPRVDPDR